MDTNMIIIWIIALFVFAVVEISTVSLVSIWFCIGSVGGIISAAIGLDLSWQIIIFSIISIILIFATRPFAKKFLTPKIVKTNYDRIIGMECIVTEDIDNILNKGSVKVLGQIWTARANDKDQIKAGELVKVLEISGVKLIVEKIKITQKGETEKCHI